MGILEGVLGPSFPTKKFKNLLDEALGDLKYSLHRIPSKITEATSKATRLLKAGRHKKADEEVDVVIQNQNKRDAFNIIIGYLPLLIDDVDSFDPKCDIPEEHFEAVSSLIFAAPRLKLLSFHLTAIQDVRKILLRYFGQSLAAQYLEIRNDCGINPLLIEKLSEEPSVKKVRRMKLLKEIAAKENIVLKLEKPSTSTKQGTSSKAELASEDETRNLSDPAKSRKRDQKGKEKQTDLADPEKAVEAPSKGPPVNKKSGGQNRKDNDDGSSEGEKKNQKGKGKEIDLADLGKAMGAPSKGPPVNKKSGQDRKDNDDSSSEGEKKNQKRKGKQIDLADLEKSVGAPSKGPLVNKKSGQETVELLKKDVFISYSKEESLDHYKNNAHRKGNDDGSSKGEKKKQTDDVTEKSLGNPSNSLENEESEQEQKDKTDGLAKGRKKKHTHVRSASEGSVSHSDDSKFDEYIEKLLNKDVDITYNEENSGDVDHMFQETPSLRRPMSVRTRQF